MGHLQNSKLEKRNKIPVFKFIKINKNNKKYAGWQIIIFRWFIEFKKCPDWKYLFTKFRGYNFIQIYSSGGFSICFKWFKVKQKKINRPSNE